MQPSTAHKRWWEENGPREPEFPRPPLSPGAPRHENKDPTADDPEVPGGKPPTHDKAKHSLPKIPKTMAEATAPETPEPKRGRSIPRANGFHPETRGWPTPLPVGKKAASTKGPPQSAVPPRWCHPRLIVPRHLRVTGLFSTRRGFTQGTEEGGGFQASPGRDFQASPFDRISARH